jgi:hypothetical protein
MKKPDPINQNNSSYQKDIDINEKTIKETMIEVSDVSKIKIGRESFDNMMSAGKMVKLSNIYTPVYEASVQSDYINYLNRQYLTPNDNIYISKIYSDLN